MAYTHTTESHALLLLFFNTAPLEASNGHQYWYQWMFFQFLQIGVHQHWITSNIIKFHQSYASKLLLLLIGGKVLTIYVKRYEQKQQYCTHCI